MKEGIEHPGFSFIEVMAQCPTQAGRYMEGSSNPGELLRLLKKRAVPAERAKETSAEEMAGKFTVGKLHHSTGKREFSQAIYESFPEEKKSPKDLR
jgi:2-oxoglutarate ferredoxin oxidoreductase subunit beta